MLIKLNIFTFFGLIDLAIIPVLELLVVPIISIFYLIYNRDKTIFFVLFLVCYSISDLIHLIDLDSNSDLVYFLCSSLYVTAYVFLLFEIIKTLNFRILYQKFLIQSIVLLALVIYLFTVLCSIIEPIFFDIEFSNWVKFTEHFYNLVLLLLLAVSFLNYLEKDSRKSLLLFIGCLAISNSEFLLIGYYYLSDIEILSYIATFLNIFAFLMFYIQSKLKNDLHKNSKVFS